ncbi:hypothetical protein M6B38_230560 [Iris pallida]|uniref:Uncharacterized protein n=1 Tax=Iris pallida TaxID=29817 RepID=A0AAX6DRW0_IRIPA|nr:hypothetical protein M6B38_230560 [Iris pallida]
MNEGFDYRARQSDEEGKLVGRVVVVRPPPCAVLVAHSALWERRGSGSGEVRWLLDGPLSRWWLEGSRLDARPWLGKTLYLRWWCCLGGGPVEGVLGRRWRPGLWLEMGLMMVMVVICGYDSGSAVMPMAVEKW